MSLIKSLALCLWIDLFEVEKQEKKQTGVKIFIANFFCFVHFFVVSKI